MLYWSMSLCVRSHCSGHDHLFCAYSFIYSASYFDIPLCNWLAAGKVGVPRQLVITEDPTSIPRAVIEAGLTLPLGILPIYVSKFVVPDFFIS